MQVFLGLSLQQLDTNAMYTLKPDFRSFYSQPEIDKLFHDVMMQKLVEIGATQEEAELLSEDDGWSIGGGLNKEDFEKWKLKMVTLNELLIRTKS